MGAGGLGHKFWLDEVDVHGRRNYGMKSALIACSFHMFGLEHLLMRLVLIKKK